MDVGMETDTFSGRERGAQMNRNLALEFVRVTELSAIAAARLMGRGEEKAADQAAVDAMRKGLDSIDCDATVVIGEGERDEAPMLFIGEKVGNKNGPALELALDPLEGTTICAKGKTNSVAVMAIAPKGGLLHAPDTYMMKIAVGPKCKGIIDIRLSPTENLHRIAEKKRCTISELTVMVLDRPRHENLIREIREAGARIYMIEDGDVAGAISTCYPDSGVDVLMGTGGAPEGVIAAAALQCLGGDFQGILQFRSQEEIQRAREMGITDVDKVFSIDDLAHGDLMFCATGVTQGPFLDGVRFRDGGCTTHSIVMRSNSGTVRDIRATHRFDRKQK